MQQPALDFAHFCIQIRPDHHEQRDDHPGQDIRDERDCVDFGRASHELFQPAVGGGIETAAADFMQALFGSNAKLRFEYRYTDFGTFSQDVPLAATGACGTAGFVCTGNAHIDMRAAFHTFRVGLGFNLGEPIAPTYRIVK